MLDTQDIQQFKGILEENNKTLILEVGKVLEQNILPILDDHGKMLEAHGKMLVEHGERLGRIEATMVTKSYLDDKLADLEGHLISKLRKEDEKLNRLVELLANKSILAVEDVAFLRQIEVFPSLPKVSI
ncbi:MAG: hypothetical protein WC659_07000 [Patescibacteria group bacterium]